MVPLQVPGGPELLIIGLMALIFTIIPIVIVGVTVYRSRRDSSDPVPPRQRVDDPQQRMQHQRIEELEQRVEALEEERDRQDGSRESEHSTTE